MENNFELVRKTKEMSGHLKASGEALRVGGNKQGRVWKQLSNVLCFRRTWGKRQRELREK